jgi:hypothetical protein
MAVVTNEEELNSIQEALIKKKYKNIDTSNTIVSDEENEIVTKAIEEKNKKDGFFVRSIDFLSDFFTGNNREEFSKMGELNNAPLTNIGNSVKLGIGFSITPSVEAQIDMVKNLYPNAVVSRDKFENVVITLPDGAVKKGTDRTFYLNKPGFTFKDAVEGVAQVLQYIPGAGFVYKKVGGGIVKKSIAQGGSAAVTGATQDVVASNMGSKAGEGGIPIIEDDRLLLNSTFGMAGEPIGKFLQRFSGFNFVKDLTQKVVPSKFNIFSGSGLYINNKGKITDKAKTLAKQNFEDLNLVNDKKVMKEFAQALEDGIDPSLAVQIVGANKYGISLWKAQASGNQKVLKWIEQAKKGVHGEDLKNIVNYQAEIQLKQSFDYLTKFRNSLIRNKNTQRTTTLPGQKTPVEDTIDNITNQINTIKSQMDEAVEAKYSAIDWTGKIKAPVVNNVTKNMRLVVSSSDGIGMNLNKDITPKSLAWMNDFDKFLKGIKDNKVTKITLDSLESKRRNLNTIISTTKDATDKKALLTLKGEFDKFYDKTIQGALSSGDKAVLQAIKDARAESSKVKKIFEPNNVGKVKDQAGAYLNNILNGKYSALQINNYLYGNASLSANSVKQSTDILNRLTKTIFPKGSEGFDLLVDGSVQRMLNNSFKKVGTNEIFDPKIFIKEVEQMMNGNGKEISKILFTKKQQEDLLGFAKELQKTTDINDFKQVEGGAKKFLGVFQSFARSLAGIAGFQAGGIQATLGARFFFDAVAKTAKHNQAIDDITNAIAFSKLPSASGGQGLIQTAYENQTILPKMNDQDQSTLLEQMSIIENLNKYR